MIELMDQGADILLGQLIINLPNPNMPQRPPISPDLSASTRRRLVGMPFPRRIDRQINLTNEAGDPGPSSFDIFPGFDEAPIGLRLAFPGDRGHLDFRTLLGMTDFPILQKRLSSNTWVSGHPSANSRSKLLRDG